MQSGSGGHQRATNNNNGPTSTHRSPHDFLQARASFHVVQKQKATKSLADFFGL